MAPAKKEHDKPSITPPSTASHGGASSRRAKPESSRRRPSPSKGQMSPRGPSKKSTQKDQTGVAAGVAAGEATVQDVAEAAEIDELKELFGTSSRNAQIGEAVPTTANAPKAEQQPAELESVPEDPPPAQDRETPRDRRGGTAAGPHHREGHLQAAAVSRRLQGRAREAPVRSRRRNVGPGPGSSAPCDRGAGTALGIRFRVREGVRARSPPRPGSRRFAPNRPLRGSPRRR